MTDTCPSWPTLLAWLENDLPDEESRLLNTHVAGCDECREKLAVMKAVQGVGPRRGTRHPCHQWGIPLFLLITVPWYAYHWFTSEIFVERLHYDYLKRFSRPEGHHDGAITYYVERLAYGLFPWTALALAAVFCVRPQSGEDLRRKQLFFVCWFLCPFLMFSASETKFSYYIAPVLPPLAVLAAASLSTYLQDNGSRARHFAMPILALGIFLLPARLVLSDPGFLLGTITIKNSINQVYARVGDLFSHPQMTHLVMFGLFAAILFALAIVSFWKIRKYGVVALCLVAVALGVYNAQIMIVNLSPHKSQKLVIEKLKTMMGPDDELVLFFPGKDVMVGKERASIEGSAVFYMNDEIVELNNLDDARKYYTTAGHGFCIVRSRYLPALKRLFKDKGLTMNVVDTSNYRFTAIEVTRAPSD